MINIEIDGQPVAVNPGTTIIAAADALGIPIPRFCYHNKLSVAANCRMCLVQVEKFNKPMPACATPATEGMKIWTRSAAAVAAQQSVMEFLLINHPLDCPICDEGGECDLQDIAVAYGAPASRYREEKRVVVNKNIGPLIATDMTRCIHCTRCVRFLKEIGGMLELGLVNRGEHAEITAYVDRSIESELSGNIIDLCPVGALTSKPFRFTARSWELKRRPAIAAHDGLGTHIEVQVKNNRVMRVLPRIEESINECWLSDRDRFAYTGLNSADRLTKPMLRRDGSWVEVSWQEALEFAASRLLAATQNKNGEALGVLVSPDSTLEEGYLAKKIAAGLGCGNIDYRLRQSDFRLDAHLQGVPWLGCQISELSRMDRLLVIGSNLRSEHPLIAHRLRQAVQKHGAELSLINPLADDPWIPVAHKVICPPDAMVHALLRLLKATSGIERWSPRLPSQYSELLANIGADDDTLAMARSLAGLGQDYDLAAPRCGILLGNIAQHHPRFAEIYSLAEAIALQCGATFGVLAEAANSVGMGLIMRTDPTALNSRSMLQNPRPAYLLVNLEAGLDCHNGQLVRQAIASADSVVALTMYWSEFMRDADVLLPIAPYTETSGTLVNMEGRVQSFAAAVQPLGECRPGWKVLRVLGNLLGLSGFDYDSSEQVKHEIFGGVEPAKVAASRLVNRLSDPVAVGLGTKKDGLQRIGEVPLAQSDAIVRRALPLQQAGKDSIGFVAMNASELAKQGLLAGGRARVRQEGASVELPVRLDARVPDGCARVPVCAETATLGDLYGCIEVEAA